MTAPGVEGVLAGVLAGHVFIGGVMTIGGWSRARCTCGHEYDNPNATAFHSHPQHVAAEQAKALAEWAQQDEVVRLAANAGVRAVTPTWDGDEHEDDREFARAVLAAIFGGES